MAPATLPASDMQSTGFAVNKTTVHANTPHNGMPPAFFWFRQSTDPGRMALGLPVGDFFGDTADDALAHVLHLSRAEPLLTLLEGWWHTAIDPAPCPAPHEDAVWELRLADETLAPAGSVLWLPASSWLAAPPPARLCQPHVQWPGVPCAIDVDDLSVDMLGMLQPGGLVLLPRSLQPTWYVRIRAVSVALPLEPMGATLDLHARSLMPLAGRPAPNASDRHAPQTVQVRLDDTVTWPLDLLHGWSPVEAAPARTLTNLSASLWLDRHCCARGHLVPAGRGHGLWIDTVSLPAQAIDIVLDAACSA